MDAFIIKFEKDNFRSSILTLIFYQTGYLSYVMLPEGYLVGDKLKFSGGATTPTFLGQALPLRDIIDGAFIFNIEL